MKYTKEILDRYPFSYFRLANGFWLKVRTELVTRSIDRFFDKCGITSKTVKPSIYKDYPVDDFAIRLDADVHPALSPYRAFAQEEQDGSGI
jgi:hypothetical protein